MKKREAILNDDDDDVDDDDVDDDLMFGYGKLKF